MPKPTVKSEARFSNYQKTQTEKTRGNFFYRTCCLAIRLDNKKVDNTNLHRLNRRMLKLV